MPISTHAKTATTTVRSRRAIMERLIAIAYCALLVAFDGADIGPETEKRFPPLRVPPGFKATLFACDPLIEYPSAIALGPKPGSIFVAIDYMTGLGTEITRRDEIRLVEDTNGDGYADKATVYAAGFNSIEGMTFHDGTVYAMHSPLLTALRDTDGDGVADERKDLLNGLGLAPEDNPPRLHCANGIVWGYDGWLYLALGDHGCSVLRPEGDRFVLEGGGILRCRPDGTSLHLFSCGLRNIYDVALDEDLNVFVRDNENDGGDYKIRVCHSFFGATHGYPYLYYERPEESLQPLADLGLGSSAGGAVYLESQFPPDYRGNLFFCEWGRAVMRSVPVRSGGGFAPLKEIEFASGGERDPYGFKPTDLVVERDGALVISDWGDGQRPKRGRGRIYRVTYENRAQGQLDTLPQSIESWIEQLDSSSYLKRIAAQVELQRLGKAGISGVRSSLRNNKLGVRGQLHAVWLLAHANAAELPRLFPLDSAKTAIEPRIRVQVIRALADHGIDLARRQSNDLDWGIAPQITDRVYSEPMLRLEQLNFAARLRTASPRFVEAALTGWETDTTLIHAAQQAIRQSPDWQAILKELDRRPATPIRSILVRALGERPEADLIDAVISRLQHEPEAARRLEYADLLTRVCNKPGPWIYWGYRPPPRPANTIEWERTGQITESLNQRLLDPDHTVRLALLRKMQREKIATRDTALETWLAAERDPESVAAILINLANHSGAVASGMLARVIQDPEHALDNRLQALKLLVGQRASGVLVDLLPLAVSLEDGPILAAVLDQLSTRREPAAGPMLVRRASSPDAEVRAAAVRAIGQLQWADARETVQMMLKDQDPRVRRDAAAAAARLQLSSAGDELVLLARDSDVFVQEASINALRHLRDARALPAALDCMIRAETHSAAIAYVAQFGNPQHATVIAETARRNPSCEVLGPSVSVLTRWADDATVSGEIRAKLNSDVTKLQGASGELIRWRTRDLIESDSLEQLLARIGKSVQPFDWRHESNNWISTVAQPVNGSFLVRMDKNASGGWVGLSDIFVSETTNAQFLTSSDGGLRVWVNGERVFQRDQPSPFLIDSDRFTASLKPGLNRVLIHVSASNATTFHMRFRPVSSRSEHEQLIQAALSRSGSIERGAKVFLDAEKSQCLKCHRLDERGEKVGPELTGVGDRFSRIHIIESILDPSRTLAPSFEAVTVGLKDGRVLSGLRIAESESTLTLVDNQAVRHTVAKSAIEQQRAQVTSIMPDGLEKRFTLDEFVDLVSFLVSQKSTAASGR